MASPVASRSLKQAVRTFDYRSPARKARYPHAITVPDKVAKRVETLATHLRRRMDQMRAERAAISAAKAATIEESIKNILTSESRSNVPFLFRVGNS